MMGSGHRRLLRALLVSPLLLVAGCTYAQHRADDLADCFELNVGVGYGLYAQVAVTDLLAPSLGYKKSWRAGWDGPGRLAGTWRESAWSAFLVMSQDRGAATGARALWTNGVGWPWWLGLVLRPSALGPGAKLDVDLPDSVGDWAVAALTAPVWIPLSLPPLFAPVSPRWHEISLDGSAAPFPFVDRTWINVDLMAGPVGARAGVNPVEIIDAVLGLATIDILSDDGDTPQAREDEGGGPVASSGVEAHTGSGEPVHIKPDSASLRSSHPRMAEEWLAVRPEPSGETEVVVFVAHIRGRPGDKITARLLRSVAREQLYESTCILDEGDESDPLYAMTISWSADDLVMLMRPRDPAMASYTLEWWRQTGEDEPVKIGSSDAHLLRLGGKWSWDGLTPEPVPLAPPGQ